MSKIRNEMKKEDSIKAVLREAIFHELKTPKEDISIVIQGSVADIETGHEKFSVWERQAIDEDNEKALIYELMHPYTA